MSAPKPRSSKGPLHVGLSALLAIYGCATPEEQQRAFGPSTPVPTASSTSPVPSPSSSSVPSPSNTAPPELPSGASPPQPWTAPGLSLFDDPTSCEAQNLSAGRSRLRRLTRLEYNNSVRDLLGDDSRPANAFVADQKVLGFNNNAYAAAGTTIAREYVLTAETLARAAVSSNLSSLMDCGPEPSDACISEFIRRFALRAFRAPIEPAHFARLQTLYLDTSTRFGLAAGIEAVLTSILSSPRFLYVLEYGADSIAPLEAPNRAVSQYELAARLSFYLWRSVPDLELLELAGLGELADASRLQTQAERMLRDPRAISAVQDFAEQWLELDGLEGITKDSNLGFAWTPEVARALRTESLLTYSNAVLSEGSTLAQLLLSPTSYINGELGEYYAVPVSNLVFGRRDVNPDPARPIRLGLLGQGGVLARHAHATLASPVLRGKLVRDKFLCRPVPPPDSAIVGIIPPAPNTHVVGKTTRDLVTA
ncbi:MAG TPA: DUF1592 domain-containing protein, partial [Polyangiaceae bacterium]|nr:DUF1592 domain-containing protein [Polyangiaceae bacterium]